MGKLIIYFSDKNLNIPLKIDIKLKLERLKWPVGPIRSPIGKMGFFFLLS